MKQLLAIAFITLLALGIGCAWISPSSQTTSDGIQVHGHWELKISPTQGKPVTYKFNNDLTGEGGDILLRLLADEPMIGQTQNIEFSTTEDPWWIVFGFTNTRWGCDERAHVSSANNRRHRVPASKTLQGQSFAVASRLILTATCTVKDSQDQFNASTGISEVSTELLVADPTLSERRVTFTETQIASIAVQTDYVISATVTISLN